MGIAWAVDRLEGELELGIGGDWDQARVACHSAAVELRRLPALVHIRQDLEVLGVAEGWQAAQWTRAACQT